MEHPETEYPGFVQMVKIRQNGLFVKKEKKQVLLTCPHCLKKFKTDYRKRAGRFKKNRYLVPAHGSCRREIVTF